MGGRSLKWIIEVQGKDGWWKPFAYAKSEDEAREKEAAEDERRRNRNRKGRRSTILTSPTYGDTTATTDKPTLLGG